MVGKLFGWVRGMFSSPSWKQGFFGREILGWGVCAYHEVEKAQGACFTGWGCTCLFPGRRSEGHRDVPVKICQNSGNETACTALGSKLEGSVFHLFQKRGISCSFCGTVFLCRISSALCAAAVLRIQWDALPISWDF